jgi:putative DNA primase/helicase
VGRWRLPVLAGLINAPTLRTDGSILSASGYDEATGLLLDPDGGCFPTVPNWPGKTEAFAALQLLDDLIATFPFVDRSSRASALSAILTACIRRSLPTAPMHGFTAPVASSGKSMLVDLISLIAGGREAGVMSQGKTEEELEKRLGAQLLAGDHVIAIDNCETPLGGEFLCAMLTQLIVRARILGVSKTPELPTNASVTATGNNLVLIGDMTRRAMICRLDPQHERPELRRFETNPVALVKAERGRYLVAALTVLRAYHVAGRPEQPDPLGSFEGWSGWVRGALLWLGQADPVDTIEATREMDPRLNALTSVVAQWRSVIGGENVSVRTVIERATEQQSITSGAFSYPKVEFAHPDFREALLVIAGEGGAINGKRLGKWLASHRDRIVAGARIVRSGLSAGIMRWRIEVDRSQTGAP